MLLASTIVAQEKYVSLDLTSIARLKETVDKNLTASCVFRFFNISTQTKILLGIIMGYLGKGLIILG